MKNCYSTQKKPLQICTDALTGMSYVLSVDVRYVRWNGRRKGVCGSMKVLIACEESQAVCKAFRELGYEAYSADIQECSGGHPEWHILGDVLPIINGNCVFWTCDDKVHSVDGQWDLLIAHPPCTYLSNAGACRFYPKKRQLDMVRYGKGLAAKQFFMKFYNADCKHIAIENPMPSLIFELPEKSQVIQPYQFGEPYSKKTYLWLKGLPKLKGTSLITDYKPYVSCGTSANKGNPEKSGVSRSGGAQKVRSKTFPGIAKAMAEQWSNLRGVINEGDEL